jgi:SpoVK/Ycf46/Vps4 family AAA+-type ATPase
MQNALKFKWHCEFGIEENLEKLRKEFTWYRNPNPVKILITSPPARGKSYLSEKNSKYYKLPVNKIKSPIELGKNLPESDPLSKVIKRKFEELRDKMIKEFEQSNNKNLQGARFKNIIINIK